MCVGLVWRLSFSILTLCWLLNACLLTTIGKAEEISAMHKVFSLHPTGQSLAEIAKKLSEETGYSIFVVNELKNIPVSGIYNHVTIDSFFRRVIRDKNFLIEYNDDKKSVMVRFFDSDARAQSLKNEIAVPSSSFPGWQSDSDSKDMVTNLSRDELKEQQKKQLKLYFAWQSDPDSIDPMTGLRRGELKKQQKKQLESYSVWQNDPDAMDPMTGLRRGELKEQQKKQLESYSAWRSDSDAIDPMTGLRRGELKEQQKKQLESYSAWRSDPNSIDPMTGLRRGELIERQRRQLAAFKARQDK